MFCFGVILLILSICPVGLSQSGDRLIGFDCHDSDAAVSSISLKSSYDCNVTSHIDPPKPVIVQLLQLTKVKAVPYIQCFIQKTTMVTGCGRLTDYSWAVKGGYKDEIIQLSHSECERIHTTRMYRVRGDTYIDIVRENEEYYCSYIASGSRESDGSCSGGEYSLNGHDYKHVVAEVFLKIRISKGVALHNRDTNRLTLESGTSIPFSDGQVMDIKNGQSFWETKLAVQCGRSVNDFNTLYTGLANRTTSAQSDLAMITVTSGKSAFSLEVKEKKLICGEFIHTTEHPQLLLFISYDLDSQPPFEIKESDISSIDFSLYLNNKFVYIERHVGEAMNRMYQNLMIQRCKIEKKTVQNLLTLSLISPDEFAYALMEAPGFTAVVHGEVAHILKCTPIPVQIAQSTDRYYKEIKVIYGRNQTGFISPRNRILQTIGTEVVCHPLLPTLYKIGKSWISVYPRPTVSVAPADLQLTKGN